LVPLVQEDHMPKGRIHGVGVYDGGYSAHKSVGGKVERCPYYVKWSRMLDRCYSAAWHAQKPTYAGCSVVPEWHSFSNFRDWMETQPWEGRELDKDVLAPGNKIYGPDTCAFISPELNAQVQDRPKGGEHLPGVWVRKGRIYARARIHGKKVYIGRFATEEQAHAAWVEARSAYLRSLAALEPDPRVAEGVERHIALLGAFGA
jgi:hypothetical protein